jgi:hypothetical protein
MPSVCVTLSTRPTFLIRRLPSAPPSATSLIKTVPVAWRFSLSEISPSGVFSFSLPSAAWKAAWLPERSPYTSFRPAMAASVAL